MLSSGRDSYLERAGERHRHSTRRIGCEPDSTHCSGGRDAEYRARPGGGSSDDRALTGTGYDDSGPPPERKDIR